MSPVGHRIAPFHPVFIFGTVATFWIVLSCSNVVVVALVLSTSSVVATIMGHVGAARVTPVFPLPPDFRRVVRCPRGLVA